MKKKISLGLIAFSMILNFIFLAIDYNSFNNTKQGDTVWYDSRWYIQPYTNFMLNDAQNEREFWTKNPNVNQTWLVRETIFNEVRFWTTLERKDKL